MHVAGENAKFNFGVLAEDTAHALCLQCRQAILSRALANELLGDALHLGAPIPAVFQDDRDVSIMLNNELIRGSVLIGYDGVRSLMREAIGANLEGATYPESTIRVNTYFRFQGHLKGFIGRELYLKKRVPIHF